MTPHLIYTPISSDVDMAVTARQGLYDQPTVLFVHGLGDSSLAWRGFFDDERLAPFTLLAPDLPGYGQTLVRNGSGGGFDLHLTALRRLIDETVGGPLLVVAHSMGGLLATLTLRALEREAASTPPGEPLHSPVTLLGFVNIEGNLTEADAYISSRAVAAAQGKLPFSGWFDAYRKTSTYGPWAKAHPHYSHYGESLAQANPDAFLKDSQDLVEWRQREDERSGEPAAGAEYLRLRVRKCYICGSESISDRTMDFIAAQNLRYHEIEGGYHWTMLDDPEFIVQLILKRLAKV